MNENNITRHYECVNAFMKVFGGILMSILADGLKKCRKNINKTQREVSNELGISEISYQNYELGRREPKVETLNKLADYFDVSLDFLTGRSDNPKRQ